MLIWLWEAAKLHYKTEGGIILKGVTEVRVQAGTRQGDHDIVSRGGRGGEAGDLTKW